MSPTKPKYKYDIKIIERLESKGLSVRAIARKMGWPEDPTRQWLKRNWPVRNQKVWYTKKE